MVTEVERLSVLIEANTKAYERAMARVETRTNQAIRRSEKAVAALDKRFQQAGRAAQKLAGILGVSFGTAALVRGFQNSIEAAAALGDAADRAGVSAEKLQELRFALDQNGASARDADEAIRRFTRRLGEFANSGGGPAAKAFEDLNINIRDAQGNLLDAGTVFDEAVAKLGELSTTAEISARSAQLFGDDAGPRLVKFLSQGIGGLRQYEQQLRDLGGVMDEEGVRKAQELDEAFKRLTLRVSVLSKEFAVNLASGIETAAGAFDGFRTDIENYLNNPSLRRFLDVITIAPTAQERAQRNLINELERGGNLVGPDRLPRIRPVQAESDAVAETVIADAAEEAARRLRGLAQNAGERVDNAFAEVFGDRDTPRGTRTPRERTGRQRETETFRQLREEISRAQDFADFFAESTTNTIEDLLTGVTSLSDAFKNLAASIGSAALQAALLGEGPLSLNGEGLLSNLFRGAFGTQSIGGRGGQPLNLLFGGNFQHGGSGRVPGTGMPDSTLFVARTTPGEAFAFGSSAQRGNTTVNVITPPGSEVEETRRQSGGREIIDIAIAANKRAMSRGDFDGALRSRFGAQPTVTQKTG